VVLVEMEMVGGEKKKKKGVAEMKGALSQL
jgi:hypothetical protein